MMTNRSQIAIRIHCIGVIVSAVFMTSVQAASFDCARAASFSEKAVCGDATLSSLDDTLGARYASAYAVTPDKRALAAARDHAWRWRQTHCHDKECVADWYARRIAELGADIDRYARVGAAVALVTPAAGEPVAPKVATERPITTQAQAAPERPISTWAQAAPQVATQTQVPVATQTQSQLATQVPVPVRPVVGIADAVRGARSEADSPSPTVHRTVGHTLPNGPLPPDFTDQPTSPAFLEAHKPIDTAETADVLPLPASQWGAPSPVLSQATRPETAAGYRLFNKGERTSARTIGIFVGF